MRAPDDFYFVCNNDEDTILYHAVVDALDNNYYDITWTRKGDTFQQYLHDTRRYLETHLSQLGTSWRIIEIVTDFEPDSEFENLEAIL